jgi:hypothetical protein
VATKGDSSRQKYMLKIGEDFYWEDGKCVFTEQYLLKRGHCCSSGCRHCPYRSKDQPLNNKREKDEKYRRIETRSENGSV